LLVDEIWDISPEVVFTALRPSQIAVKNPMMMMFSTAGDQGSTVLLQLREQGMAAIDSGRTGSLYFAEWSLPPGVSLEDRRYWGWANPALGTTITMKALELAFDSPNRQAFIRGHLNLWVDSTNSYLPINLWQDRQTVDPMPAIQWLVIDSSVDESRYVGIGCAYDGTRVIVTTEFVVESAQQMWAEVVKRMTDPQVKLACTPSLEIHCPSRPSPADDHCWLCRVGEVDWCSACDDRGRSCPPHWRPRTLGAFFSSGRSKNWWRDRAQFAEVTRPD
jgi:hypothetical protein